MRSLKMTLMEVWWAGVALGAVAAVAYMAWTRV